MKKICKYPTGAEIPEDAVYLGTVTQTMESSLGGEHDAEITWENCWYVWHYFLVEVDKKKKVSRR